MKQIHQIIKYLDMFGVKFSFYIEKSRKLNSFKGGVLTLIAIFLSFIFFLIMSLDDLKRITPLTNISSYRPEEYQKINLGKEKIWIPWRIRDYSNNFINHTNILYPFIYNYYGIKNNINEGFDFKIKPLNYTLCNQTSFINRPDIINIDSSLDELYCIEMDDIDIGGDWASDYLSYIEFNLYLCKEGIDYDENNPYCTRNENISNYLGYNNSLIISLYYPVIQFRANMPINPITILYREMFYKISGYTNKIDKIFLRNNILKDNIGWIGNKYKETSYWGLHTLQSDSYTIGNRRDFMNGGGSTSKVYSFNIYLDSSINVYYRSYKKLYVIISECMPIFYCISFIFKTIATIFKFYRINKNITEYLFINLKHNSFEKKMRDLKKVNQKSHNALDFVVNINNHNNNNIHSNNLNNNFQTNSYERINKLMFNEKMNKNTDNLNQPYFSSKKSNNIMHKKLVNPIKEKLECSFKDNSLEILNKNRGMFSSKSNVIRDNKDNKQFVKYTIKTNTNLSNNKIESLAINKNNNNCNEKFKRKNAKKISLVENAQNHIQSICKNLQKNEQHKHYIHRKLFPSKYYFYSIFIKNLDILKKTKLFSTRFALTYMFISKLMDIYSYLDLIKEFNVFTTYFLNEKNISIIEKNRKINIGDYSFSKNIKDCFDNNHFRIFGKKKEDINLN